MQSREKKVHTCKIPLSNDNGEFSIPGECGPSWWRILHNTVSAIETDGCPSCGEHAVKLMSFLHDLVNQDLSKPVYDPKNVLGFEGLTQKLFEQSRKQLAGSKGVMETRQPAREKNGQTADNNFDSVSLPAVKPCNSTLKFTRGESLNPLINFSVNDLLANGLETDPMKWAIPSNLSNE